VPSLTGLGMYEHRYPALKRLGLDMLSPARRVVGQAPRLASNRRTRTWGTRPGESPKSWELLFTHPRNGAIALNEVLDLSYTCNSSGDYQHVAWRKESREVRLNVLHWTVC